MQSRSPLKRSPSSIPFLHNALRFVRRLRRAFPAPALLNRTLPLLIKVLILVGLEQCLPMRITFNDVDIHVTCATLGIDTARVEDNGEVPMRAI